MMSKKTWWIIQENLSKDLSLINLLTFTNLFLHQLNIYRHACPVYSEVIAPYWANNTRDQVLALLNLQPFEQYIHMEKCKFEHEEMLCRKGCRCEQQYRLHRLLAFDPNNECRGIFSDWFRFPSYCICKFILTGNIQVPSSKEIQPCYFRQMLQCATRLPSRTNKPQSQVGIQK